jgi:hypothetical protein
MLWPVLTTHHLAHINCLVADSQEHHLASGSPARNHTWLHLFSTQYFVICTIQITATTDAYLLQAKLKLVHTTHHYPQLLGHGAHIQMGPDAPHVSRFGAVNIYLNAPCARV